MKKQNKLGAGVNKKYAFYILKQNNLKFITFFISNSNNFLSISYSCLKFITEKLWFLQIGVSKKLKWPMKNYRKIIYTSTTN